MPSVSPCLKCGSNGTRRPAPRVEAHVHEDVLNSRLFINDIASRVQAVNGIRLAPEESALSREERAVEPPIGASRKEFFRVDAPKQQRHLAVVELTEAGAPSIGVNHLEAFRYRVVVDVTRILAGAQRMLVNLALSGGQPVSDHNCTYRALPSASLVGLPQLRVMTTSLPSQ